MTTVISRVYADEATAQGVVDALHAAGHPQINIDVMTGGGDDVAGQIAATKVAAETAAIYAGLLTQDGATLVVTRAQITPFGAARSAMAIMNGVASLPADGAEQDRYVREQPSRALTMGGKILPDHPLILTSKIELGRKRSLFSEVMYWPLLSKPKTRRSAMSGTRFMSRKFWPQPLISTKARKITAIAGGKRMMYNPKALSA